MFKCSVSLVGLFAANSFKPVPSHTSVDYAFAGAVIVRVRVDRLVRRERPDPLVARQANVSVRHCTGDHGFHVDDALVHSMSAQRAGLKNASDAGQRNIRLAQHAAEIPRGDVPRNLPLRERGIANIHHRCTVCKCRLVQRLVLEGRQLSQGGITPVATRHEERRTGQRYRTGTRPSTPRRLKVAGCRLTCSLRRASNNTTALAIVGKP